MAAAEAEKDFAPAPMALPAPVEAAPVVVQAAPVEKPAKKRPRKAPAARKPRAQAAPKVIFEATNTN